MRIWLGTIGEPWPTDSKNPRLLRTGVMALHYARGGDEIVWFNDTFDAPRKRHRFAIGTMLQAEPRLTLIGLHGSGYARNVSLARIRYHRQLANEFTRLAEPMQPPDAIVASMPPLELAEAMMRYGQAHNVPVVTDIRDLWPDIWVEVAPRPLWPFAKALLKPYYNSLARIVAGSSAISGVSELAVDWALSAGHRARNPFDGILPLAYEPPVLTPDEIARASAFWSAQGIVENGHDLVVCYFGVLSRRYEFEPVFRALEMMSAQERSRVRIVICGAGEAEAGMRSRLDPEGRIQMPGWMDAAQIEVLKRRAHVGLLPYPSSQDYVQLLPNKVFDYLTGGLPILTSLKGNVANLVTGNGVGWLYENNDAADLKRHLVRLEEDRAGVMKAAEKSVALAARYSAKKIYDDFRARLVAIVESGRAP